MSDISEAKPLVDNHCTKAGIKFDPQQKKNVCLTVKVDITFVKSNPKPSPQFLRTNMVTEVLVYSVTNLDNSTNIPCAVDHVSKSVKSGEEIKSLFFSHYKTLEVCKSCQNISPSQDSILGSEVIQICKSSCDDCTRLKAVCSNC